MEDVLDVYRRPYDPKHPVIGLDEKPKQLIEEVREPLAVEPGKPVRYDSHYRRKGVANIFIATEPLTGKCRLQVTDRRTRADFARFVKRLVDEDYPHAERITLVMDNLNTHEIASLYHAFEPEEARRIARKLEIHPTPTHGSWLNVAEVELSVLERQCLDRRIGDKATLEREVAAWERRRGKQQVGVNWRFTTADARIKLRRLYPTIQA